MGVFSKRMNKEGAIAGMITGLLFTFSYIVYFKFISPDLNTSEHWFIGISPEGIGFVGATLNFAVAILVMLKTTAPPNSVQDLVDDIRLPVGVVSRHQ